MELINIIKYEGDNNTFIWKHPCEDFNTKTQLIVHETQEAIFFMNGQALDLFSAGRYTLETSNIPLLSKFINLPSNGETPFHCEVYFINKTEQMAIKWGTDSKVQYIDPIYKFPLSIGACGEMSLSIENSRKLLIKLVGTESILSQDKLVEFFKGILNTKIKTYIAKIMKSEQINIFEIDERLENFSIDIKNNLLKDFEDYGILLNRFVVTSIAKPDGNPQYEKFKDLHFRQYADIAEAELNKKVMIINQETEAEKVIIDSKAQAKKREQEGYTYAMEKGFDVAQNIAKNEGIGEFMNMGIGFGVMSSVGSTVGGVVGNALNSVVNNQNEKQNLSSFCENCGNSLSIDSLFCENCGYKIMKDNSCKKCNFQFKTDGNFCPKCGEKR